MCSCLYTRTVTNRMTACAAPLIPNVDTNWQWSVLTSQPVSPRKEPKKTHLVGSRFGLDLP